MDSLHTILSSILLETVDKMILSSKRNKEYIYHKLIIRQKLIGDKNVYQAEMHTTTQVFHKNMTKPEAFDFIELHIQEGFKQIDCITNKATYCIKCSKLQNVYVKSKKHAEEKSINLSHNREKSYLIKEGTIVAPLIDLGVITKDGKIIASKYDKFKQINRFIEMIEDGIGEQYKEINIIDFGCGKSYLTFILYYYLTEIKGIRANIIGLDLKDEVIKNCSQIAQKYGYSNLHFELGDIHGYQAKLPVDMVISLHACDTATDYAIHNAILWDAKLIYSVPCCQHELNKSLHSESIALLSRFGLLKERFSALSTDAIRGALLETKGYKTQLLEFIDLSHSPKNVLIRAMKEPVSPAVQQKAKEEVECFMKEFDVAPTLYTLLYGTVENKSSIEK